MSPSAPRRARVAQALLLGALAAACTALAPLHGGPWWAGFPAPARGWLALAVIAAYVVACAGILWRARARAARAAAAPARDEWLVVHASQTGQAVELATRTVEALRAAGLRARARDIATMDTAALVAARQALFVASTTGEGDAPDAAAAFLAGPMRAGAALPGLRYAVLALGDRSYRHYCAFGRALDDWLRRAGATPMFDLVDVDNGDPAALRHWQHHLGVATGAPALPDWRPAAYGAWTLAARRELNPGSAGGPVFELRLRPPPGVRADWRAGDIAEVGPRQPPAAVEAFLAASGLAPDAPVSSGHGWIGLRDLLSRSQLPDPAATRGQDAAAFAAALQPLPHREYSIASVPGEGHVRLLLRRLLRPDGSPGIGSGWLCDHAPAGGMIDLRIRANPGFHGPSPETPLVLVGNGTGIAGLRAHVAERVAAGGTRTWLLFGERHADRDAHLHEDLLAWLEDGRLARLDLAFSRDTAGAPVSAALLAAGRAAVHAGYVQDALRAGASRLREWMADGATVLVCGSLTGMAPGVDAVLRAILGDGEVDALRAAGRYRRDVY